jgi:L-ribulose-5-phosphate 3-epimerase UlaE
MALKEVSDRLKLFGNDLLALEARKVSAISCEDFEQAKAIKTEIMRVQTIVSMIDPHRPFETEGPLASQDDSLNERATQLYDHTINQREEEGLEEMKQNQDSYDQYYYQEE